MLRVVAAFCTLSLVLGRGLVVARQEDATLLANRDCSEDAPCEVTNFPAKFTGHAKTFEEFYFDLQAEDVYREGLFANVKGWLTGGRDVRLDVYIACDSNPSRDQTESWNRNSYQDLNFIKGDALSYCFARGGKQLKAMLYMYDTACIETACYFEIEFGKGATQKLEYFQTVKNNVNSWRTDLYQLQLHNVDELRIATRTRGPSSQFSRHTIYTKRSTFPRSGDYDRRVLSTYDSNEEAFFSCVSYKNPEDGVMYFAYDNMRQCDKGLTRGSNSTNCEYEVQVWVNTDRPCKFEEF